MGFKFTGSSFCSGADERSPCWQLHRCRNKIPLEALWETPALVLKLPKFTFHPFINSFTGAAQVRGSRLRSAGTRPDVVFNPKTASTWSWGHVSLQEFSRGFSRKCWTKPPSFPAPEAPGGVRGAQCWPTAVEKKPHPPRFPPNPKNWHFPSDSSRKTLAILCFSGSFSLRISSTATGHFEQTGVSKKMEFPGNQERPRSPSRDSKSPTSSQHSCSEEAPPGLISAAPAPFLWGFVRLLLLHETPRSRRAPASGRIPNGPVVYPAAFIPSLLQRLVQ